MNNSNKTLSKETLSYLQKISMGIQQGDSYWIKTAIENQEIVERLKNDYKLYKDGFSTLEGWVIDNPELRQAVDEFLESILKESQSQ